MSINYTSIIGVGVEEDEITYQVLAEHGKNIIKYIYEDSESEEEISEWFLDNIGEYDLWYELGLGVNTGNYFSGETGYRGVSVDLNNIEAAKKEFRKIVDLEPEVFNGVLVW